MVELGRGAVIEHRQSRLGRWLRTRRLRIALWIAVIEGILVVFHLIPWWAALVIAAAALGVYVAAARNAGSDVVRQAGWIAAASQVAVVLVPILVLIVGTVALVVVGILAIVALVFLFADRR
jgi:hypothetical protein